MDLTKLYDYYTPPVTGPTLASGYWSCVYAHATSIDDVVKIVYFNPDLVRLSRVIVSMEVNGSILANTLGVSCPEIKDARISSDMRTKDDVSGWIQYSKIEGKPKTKNTIENSPLLLDELYKLHRCKYVKPVDPVDAYTRLDADTDYIYCNGTSEEIALLKELLNLKNKDMPKERYLVHGDIHPGNILWNDDDSKLYLVDWSFWEYGDPAKEFFYRYALPEWSEYLRTNLLEMHPDPIYKQALSLHRVGIYSSLYSLANIVEDRVVSSSVCKKKYETQLERSLSSVQFT